jgi:hypothetical protein
MFCTRRVQRGNIDMQPMCTSHTDYAAKVALLCTTRMPRPPPPMAAFRITGRPASFAKATACSEEVSASSVPGTTGTPHSNANARALVLSPNACHGIGSA